MRGRLAVNKRRFALGFDYGTNSVRALVVDIATGEEVGTSVYGYRAGVDGVIVDPVDPNLARQDPQDYLDGLEISGRGAIEAARANTPGFDADQIIGIGVDTTGSTPMPVDDEGMPLGLDPRFAENPNAMAWLWKDHTSYEEAQAITAKAAKIRPEFLAKCGGAYSSEWFWSKIWHCLKVDPEVFEAAYTWVELADIIPGFLTGTLAPDRLKRSVCAAGHKAMFNDGWSGYPDKDFLAALDPNLARVRESLPDTAYAAGESAGLLTEEWAKRLGLRPNIAVSVGAFDAHMGAVGAGVKEGTLVKIIGTSTCDIAVASKETGLPDVPGVCGIVDGSVLPNHFGLEAGQSAVGDIFNWFVRHCVPGNYEEEAKQRGIDIHQLLTEKAERLKPGESGLMALDWNNGNRTILVDVRLSGLMLGQTLQTKPEEIYRALIEGTAYGAKVIIDRLEEYGVHIDEIVNCGGIAEKNDMLMQIYADVTNRTMRISRSAQTPALGAAMFAAVAAGTENGGYASVEEAQAAMGGLKDKLFTPIPANVETYGQLFAIYKELHDIFGTQNYSANLYHIMKELLDLRDAIRGKNNQDCL
ncbi:MAG: ribulokinase [Firmicutes bacterium]|nr:ribulokinase [Bacillota bacterium]